MLTSLKFNESMPNRKHHLECDEWLRKEGLIYEDTRGDSVHDRLDYHCRNYGLLHRELDEWHDPEAIRDWIDNMRNSIGISQELATDYVRIGYMHIAIDEACDRFLDEHGRKPRTEKEWDSVHARAHRIFSGRGHRRAHYVPRQS